MNVQFDVPTWRTFLRTLDGLTLYAFLKVLGAELHHRDLAGWRAVSDVADVVHDECQVAARAAAETLLARADTRVLDPPGSSSR